jgi:hypothetical protein
MDLYVLNYLSYALDMPQQTRQVTIGGKTVTDYLGPQPFKGAVSRLYHNRGNGTFVDVTRSAGLELEGKGMGIGAVDFDGDGRTDIYQANDSTPDFLFHNLGHGRFEETGLAAGVAVSGDGNPKSSMGVDVGDYDNDGDLDIAVPVVRQEVYSLYRNEGTFFSDASWESGLAAATGRLTGFSAHFGDFDNDGDLDLFFTNGEVHIHETANPDADENGRYGTPASLLANDGAGHFADVGRSAGPYFERALIGRGAATGDIDNDGDIDLIVSNAAGPAIVLRNDSPRAHWLEVVLRQRGPNREAIGAKVWLETNGRKQYREVQGGGGYVSANDRRLHFGLAGATKVDRLEVRWPDGARQTLTAVPADQILRVERDSAGS